MKTTHRFAAGLCALLVLPAALAAQDASELSLEALLDQEVSSASRFAQRIADAPSAITVITAEDIRRMGAIHLPDVLRMVPGLIVSTKTSGGYAVTARNAVNPASPRMLVLIDGRVSAVEIHSAPLWEAMIVSLDQVERIEVVRGPGSALYGAGAYDGVINITTKRPSGTREVIGSFAAGEAGERRASALLRQSLGALRVDGFLQTRQADLHAGGLPAADLTRLGHAGESTMGSLRLGWSNPSGVDLEVAAGAGKAKTIHYWSYGWIMTYEPTDTRFLAATYRHPALLAGADLRARATHTDRDFAGSASVRTDGEVTLDRALGAHRLVAGGVLTRVHAETSTILPHHVDQNLYGAFAQDVWALSRAVQLTTALRYDHHDLAGGKVSPRATLLARPSELHTFRFSAGRAFRNPTMLENHSELTVPLGGALNLVLLGNEALKPEAVTALEAGYIGSPHPRLTVTADLFRNRQFDAVATRVTRAMTLPGGVVVPTEMQWVNARGSDVRGGEAGVVFAAADWMRLSGNYAHLRIADSTGARTPTAPPHSFNAELGVRPLRPLWLNATYHYVGETNAAVATPAARLPGHGMVHLNADASLPRGLRASLFVQNLTDRRYRGVRGGELLGRRAVASLSVRF